MKTYKFEKLNDNAKKVAIEEMRKARESDFTLNDDFTTFCDSQIREYYPDGDFEVQFDFSFTQGSGLNLYGLVDLKSILNKHLDSFNENEEQTLRNYIKECPETYMEENPRYTYLRIQDYSLEEWIYYLEDNDYKDIDYKLIENFENVIKDDIEDFALKLYDQGCEFFNPNDQYFIEEAYDFEYEFLENGMLV